MPIQTAALGARAYAAAVHAVLAGDVPAPKALADLESRLMQITGLPRGDPQ